MPNPSTGPRYLLRWDFSRAQSIQEDIVVAWHRLCELPIASENRLRQILRQTPPSKLAINTAGGVIAHSSEWQTGSLGDLGADEAIDCLRRGRVWMKVLDAGASQPSIATLVDRLAGELCECHVGLRVLQPRADLVLSSPQAASYYSVDPTLTVLWHLSGHCRVRVYPSTDGFIDLKAVNLSVNHRQAQTLYYEPEFDQHARVVDLEPGQMIAWPHLTPYRIENTDGLNVSLRLTYQTPQSNGLCNHRLAEKFFSQINMNRLGIEHTDGWLAAAMRLLGGVLRSYHDPCSDQLKAPVPTFCLDATASDGVRSLDTVGAATQSPNINPLSNTLPIVPTASVALEN